MMAIIILYSLISDLYRKNISLQNNKKTCKKYQNKVKKFFSLPFIIIAPILYSNIHISTIIEIILFPNPPKLHVIPVSAPSTCLFPASPLNCQTNSTICATPVAPKG